MGASLFLSIPPLYFFFFTIRIINAYLGARLCLLLNIYYYIRSRNFQEHNHLGVLGIPGFIDEARDWNPETFPLQFLVNISIAILQMMTIKS